MPSSRRSKRSSGTTKKSGNPVDHLIARSHVATSSANRVSVPADFTQRPIRMNITQSPPKNLLNQIHWIQQSVTLRSSGVVSGGNVEDNWSFKLSDLNQYSTIVALFDQFCIYSVVFNVIISPSSGAVSNNLGRLTTAIDYDSIGNLGSEVTVQQFSSAQTVEVTSGLAVQRYVKPCVTPGVYVVAGTGYAVGRCWLDQASNGDSVPHYGVRVWFQITGASTAFDYDIIATYTLGCRNPV